MADQTLARTTRPASERGLGGGVDGSTSSESAARVQTVTVRYFAAAKAAAGVAQESLTLPMPATMAQVLTALSDRHGTALIRVLERCSYLLDEVAVHGPSTPVPAAAVVDVLPPFAGG